MKRIFSISAGLPLAAIFRKERTSARSACVPGAWRSARRGAGWQAVFTFHQAGAPCPSQASYNHVRST